MSDTELAERRPRSPRSPGYPTIDLKTAIERAADLYAVAPRHPVPINVAAEEWGFSPKSSRGKTVAAALKRFGFVRDVGDGGARQLALTEEGREIVFLSQDRDSDRWHELIQQAALRPKIHRQVLDQFGGPLPDDRVVMRCLLFELGFADEATAKDFLTRLKATLAFAGIEGTNELIASYPADDSQYDQGETSPATPSRVFGTAGTGKLVTWRTATGPAEPFEQIEPPQSSMYDSSRADRKAVQIPYSQSEWATLQAGFPLTESQWDALISMLQAMKPGLVQEQSEASDTSAEISDH